jgi:hypothetical protein
MGEDLGTEESVCCLLSSSKVAGEGDFFFFPGVFLFISSNKSFLSLLKLACSNSQVYH